MFHTRRDFLQCSVALAGTVGLLGVGSAANAAGPPVGSPGVAAGAAATPAAAVAGGAALPAEAGGETPASQAHMRFIGLEEHFITPEISKPRSGCPPTSGTTS